MKTLSTLLVAFAGALSLGAPAWAQQKPDPHAGHHATGNAIAAADMADGEVRKIDAEAAKVTLKHAEIKALDMPPMTMVFHVKDKAMLGNLKVGDKVKFKAVNEAGKYTVTELQVVK